MNNFFVFPWNWGFPFPPPPHTQIFFGYIAYLDRMFLLSTPTLPIHIAFLELLLRFVVGGYPTI